MDREAGRGERDNMPGSTRLSSSRNVVELVRLLARIAAERDYREAQRAMHSPAPLSPKEES
jgi:hypothetical protein